MDIRPYPDPGAVVNSNQAQSEFQMATTLSPEQYARAILAILVSHFGLRPNEVLPRKSFKVIWPQRGYRPKDFKLGLEFAAESGWLELLPGGESYRLTKSGFMDG